MVFGIAQWHACHARGVEEGEVFGFGKGLGERLPVIHYLVAYGFEHCLVRVVQSRTDEASVKLVFVFGLQVEIVSCQS